MCKDVDGFIVKVEKRFEATEPVGGRTVVA
jgi:hypothetical protein